MYEVVIGIEVHAQLTTNTKLFCGCSTQFGDLPNTNVCPVCLGMPGALPVLNKRAVEYSVMAGVALDCTINRTSVFSRKNYFYPDLPKGYQISQYDQPLCLGGGLDITVDGRSKRIGITRIHMEEDAGKLLHQGADTISGSTHSHVDLNRACTPLIEIVSEPDIRSAAEARAYVETLRQRLLYLGICDGNMDEGSLRADINISLRPTGSDQFGTRTEIKNVNSFRSIERAIHSEVARQTALLQAGTPVVQQTRQYDDATQSTRPLRDKEDSHDYRYFPEPDLYPLTISDEWITHIRSQLPELAEQKAARYGELGLSQFEIDVLLSDPSVSRYFESVTALGGRPKDSAKWIVGDINAAFKETKQSFDDTRFSPDRLVELLALIESGKISGKMAKDILVECITSGKSPAESVAASGASQISDTSELTQIVDKILDQNLDVVEKVKGGKSNSADFLMGQIMRETKGRAKPDLVKSLIADRIAAR
ncbi:Asp-tRNA(Asn)/Glu-tRNA(Gln) amidotransferase subunit GatB [bacterium]|nr:Asp-tRNA(Asn)/Glu-tRNA(Gln) amidotransferase subunit GatB [bacterium]